MTRDLVRRGIREHQRVANDFQLGSLRPPGDLLYRIAITVSRLEIQARINTVGIFGQLNIYPADRFEELLPLDLHEPAATADHIRQRSLLHHLAAVLLLHDLDHRRSEATIEPDAHHRQRRLLIVEMRHQFAGKMRGRLRMPPDQLRHQFDQPLRAAPRPGDETVRPEICCFALSLELFDLDGQ